MVLSFEDTPFFDWLQKNRFYILTFVVVLVALQAYRTMVPAWQLENRRASWSLYQDIISQFDPATNVSDSLARSRQDDRIYPWFVYAATQGSLDAGNKEAVALLKPELESLAAEASESAWKVPSQEGPVAIPAVLLARAEEFLATPEEAYTNPTPDGAQVVITVTDGAEVTYDFKVGLFEAQAPLASAAFLEAVEAGRFVGQDLTALAQRQASWKGMQAEDAPNLPLERSFGLFHTAGSLGTVIVPGEPGEQNPDILQLMITDNFSTDGSTTVFGQVVEGLDGLVELVNGVTAEQKFTISAATVKA